MQLPPLNAIKVFEVASRSRYFKSAAEDLGVTPGAIGRQIKLLEDYLGVQLFERHHAAVELTGMGRAYAERVRDALSSLETATIELSRRGRHMPLRIWCSRTFMRQWLVPRLTSFREQHPKLNLIFSTSDGLRAIDGGTVELAIRLGDGTWNESIATHLFDSHLVPVCSSAYAAKNGTPRIPSDILGHTLLQSLRRRDDWSIWLNSVGLGKRTIRNSLGFEGEGLAYQAALEGVGIALARKGFFESDVKAGRIVTLLDDVPAAKAPGAYYIVNSAQERLSPAAKAFRTWMLKQVQGSDPNAHFDR